MGAIDFARAPVHRSAEADADGCDFLARQHLRNRPLDLTPDTFGALGSLHHEPSPRADDARRVAEDELQLGAANFNAEQ